ncbi:hypothetical protein GGQ84_001542 [Desulfitispora alkaliphila]|uniref:hypothetical protein n=1 Tax=Desulfitispora alkaliphila TaxID=622674 RepID=UPI003D223CE2
MDWNKTQKIFSTREKAEKSAQIIAVTESRLLSVPKGPQYTIETKVEEVEGGWQVLWRKIFVGYDSGCGKRCGSCDTSSSSPQKSMGKVIPFKKP